MSHFAQVSALKLSMHNFSLSHLGSAVPSPSRHTRAVVGGGTDFWGQSVKLPVATNAVLTRSTKNLRRLEVVCIDYPRPEIDTTLPFLEAASLSASFPTANKPLEIVIVGTGTDETEEDGFLVPKTNSFGHSFRNYDVETQRQQGVENFYRINHINQSYEFVKRMREEYGKMDKMEMSIWECCELLNNVVDESDPDLDEPQIQHLLQTAEAIRKDYPDHDWLHLTALIHDLGKVLLHPSFGELPQWAVVGDTYPVGCAYDESIVHYKYFKENSDYNNPSYNTKYGVYYQGCGLNNILMSWGHDDYMYLVAKENGTNLPLAGLFIIRYHSFYALHKSGAYKHLMNEEDLENLKWLHVFNKYDLYSKSKERIDVEKVKPYYLSLIHKYFPEKLRW